jgi:hypothetical protein
MAAFFIRPSPQVLVVERTESRGWEAFILACGAASAMVTLFVETCFTQLDFKDKDTAHVQRHYALKIRSADARKKMVDELKALEGKQIARNRVQPVNRHRGAASE